MSPATAAESPVSPNVAVINLDGYPTATEREHGWNGAAEETYQERRERKTSTERSRLHRERRDLRNAELADIAFAFRRMRAAGGKGLLWRDVNDPYHEERPEWWHNPKVKGKAAYVQSPVSPGPEWTSVERHYLHRPSRQLPPDAGLHMRAAVLLALIEDQMAPAEIRQAEMYYPRSGKYEAPRASDDPRNRNWHRHLMRVVSRNLRRVHALPHQPLWEGENAALHDSDATPDDSKAAA